MRRGGGRRRWRARRRRDKCDGEKRGWSGGGVERRVAWRSGEFESVRTIRAREMIMCGCAAFVWGAVCDAESTRREQAGRQARFETRKTLSKRPIMLHRSAPVAPCQHAAPPPHTPLEKNRNTLSPQSHTLVFYSSMARAAPLQPHCAPRHCTQPPSLSPTPHRCPPPPPSTTSQKAPPPPLPPCPTSACCPYRTI